MTAVMILVIMAMVAAACQAQSTVTATSASDGDGASTSADAGASDTENNGAENDGEGADGGDADPAGENEAPVDGDNAGDGETTPVPVAPRPTRPVELAWFLGFSDDGAYGFDADRSPYEANTPCDQAPALSVTTIDVLASSDDDLVGFDSGLMVAGDPSQFALGPDGAGVMVTSCGEFPDNDEQLVAVQVNPDGTLAARSEPVAIGVAATDQSVWFRGMIGADVAALDVTMGEDEDYENWTREVRHVNVLSGETVQVISIDRNSNERVEAIPVTTPDGRFSYSVVDDPLGDFGCEGYGVAATLSVDDGTGPRLVFGPDQPTYASISDLHFGPDGLVAWTSSCEGGASLNLGRLTSDGSIVDAHWLDTYSGVYADPELWVDYQHFRLLSDGTVAAFGTFYDANTERSESVFRRFDLDDDPNFVNTGSSRPWIDSANPLGPTLAGTGEWFVGESLGPQPACGNRTLYASTTGGFVRTIAADREIDEVVDFAASEPRFVDYGDGFTLNTRVIAVLTECAADYVGRQLWFGSEPERPGYGMWLDQADLPALADLISIREVQQPDSAFGYDVFAEVVYRDGSVEEVLLQPVPYEG